MLQPGVGHPTRRRKYRNEGFRVVGTGREPEFNPDGSATLNRKGKQVVNRQVSVREPNRRWGLLEIPGREWVLLRPAVRTLPPAKTLRAKSANGQWHVAFVTSRNRSTLPAAVTSPD